MAKSFEKNERTEMPSEDVADVRRELRVLIMKAHPDRMPEEHRPKAEKLIRILTTLLDEATKDGATEGRVIRTWSELAAPGQSAATYNEGDSVELVRIEENGEVYGGQVQLPKWTKVFRNSLEAFFEGQSIDEVRHMLDFDPIAADRVARRDLSTTISNAPTIEELVKTQEDVLQSKVLLDKTRQELLREVLGRIAGTYAQSLTRADGLNNLSTLSKEVRELIDTGCVAAQSDKDYFLGILSTITDTRAESIAAGMLDDSDDKEELDVLAAFITAVGAYTFVDNQKKHELLHRGNQRAHAVLLERMKKARSEKSLERLHEYVNRFPFSPDDDGESVRNDLYHWIEKKWQTYHSPEAKEAQANKE